MMHEWDKWNMGFEIGYQCFALAPWAPLYGHTMYNKKVSHRFHLRILYSPVCYVEDGNWEILDNFDLKNLSSMTL